MGSLYSIIQFVPDPIADERINAGVVVFDDQGVRVRFVENWDRLQKFANKDVNFLKSFAREFEERTHSGLLDPEVNSERIREMAETWKNAIQFTSPKGSLLSLDDLLRDVCNRFLANDRRTGSPRPITRSSMRQFAFEAARLAFDRLGNPRCRGLVHKNQRIQGKLGGHDFSLAIANGKPFVAAEVFSFVGSDRRSQGRDVHARAWAYEDVARENPELELAALVVTGEEPNTAFEEAEKIFRGLNIELVQKNEIDNWADEVAGRVVASFN